MNRQVLGVCLAQKVMAHEKVLYFYDCMCSINYVLVQS